MAIYPQSAKTYRSIATRNQDTIKTGEGVILALAVLNLSRGDRFLLLQDRETFSATGSFSEVIPVYANTGYTIIDSAFFTALGENYSRGISWGFSTKPLEYEAAGLNECLLKMRYL